MSPNATSSPSRSAFDRKNPLLARVARRELLTAGCDEKETWHFEIDLRDSGLEFLPGDSLAIFPQNDPALADEILRHLGFSGEETVTAPGDGGEKPLRAALIENCAITALDRKFLGKLVEKAGDQADEIARLLDPDHKDAYEHFVWGREIIDCLIRHPGLGWEPQEFVDVLKKLNVRLYSIASSLKARPNACHLTIALVEYESRGRRRRGVCSSWLPHRTDENTPIPCFVTPGKGFRPPAPDEDVPVVMIGPGTGVAPFRAFLQEREVTGAKGKAWLFFGEIHEETCFFYRDEWERQLRDGVLHRLTTAWSRDQAQKVYVQHKVAEEGAELWKWLEEGAILYVCGDAQRMAPDVDKALHEVIATHGGRTPEQAAEYVARMRQEKRYRRDVY
ncbi:MAG: hypothetical protein KDM91_11620 [Verrucomicrobiae bacterium]|nr:hypothetical protein [Verrucomicrobiae bacterium]MCP5539729.1 protein CysJ [Akkermansiaceae bacterium]MCP5549466.1 protein CysJ [Akkermansiaceae bacterium]